MTAQTHQELVNFIWSICNLLRGPYKRNEYRKVILPMTVLRCFDCLLAPTKDAVLAKHEKVSDKSEAVVRAEACADPDVVSLARANDLHKFALGVRQRVGELMVARIGKNDQIVTRYMDDDDFQAVAFPLLAKAIWEAANEARAGEVAG